MQPATSGGAGLSRPTMDIHMMNIPARQQSLHSLGFGLIAALLAMGIATPAAAQRSATKMVATPAVVDCLLPGQIRHGPNGVPMMGPRRNVRIAAADCRVRGGEYVVAVVPKPAAPAVQRKPEDLVIVRCLLPDQVRQLGTKVTYVKVQRPARIARWDCRARGGESVKLARYQQAEATYLAVVAKNKPTKRP